MKKTYEFEHGTITYRLPNALDVPGLIGAMDVSSILQLNEHDDPHEYVKNLGLQERVDLEMKQQASIMRRLDEYITDINVEFGGEKITTWEKLVAQPAMGIPLMQVVKAVYGALNGITEQKKTPSRPRTSSGRGKRRKTASAVPSPTSSGATSGE
jgi:hypothetical protein